MTSMRREAILGGEPQRDLHTRVANLLHVAEAFNSTRKIRSERGKATLLADAARLMEEAGVDALAQRDIREAIHLIETADMSEMDGRDKKAA